MIRRAVIFCALAALAAAAPARAEVYVYTNVITSLSPSAHPLTFSTAYAARYTVYMRTAGGAAVDASDHTFAWQITDTRDDALRGGFGVEIVNATNGHLRADALFLDWEPGLYRGKIARYLNETNFDGYVADDFITIVKSCDDCGTSNVVNVTAYGSSNTTVEVASVNLRSFTADEINAVTGSYHNLNVSSNVTVQGTLTIDGSLNVGESIVAVDTSKVALAGSTMTGALTNNAGFYGDGSGLSNVTASVAALDDVGDVDVTGVADGQILQRLGGRWTNAPLTAGAGAFFIASGENIAPTSSVGNVIGAGTVLATISGGATNEIAPSALYVTIGGGVENYATTEGTVAGGKDNRAIALGATIGGGSGNDVASGSGYYDTIAGGDNNYIFSGGGSSQGRSTIGGGRQNRINNTRYATIGGGWANAITGEWSTISGGYFNSIQSNAFYASISGGHTVRLRATDTHALGGRLSGVDATNAVIVGGLRQTNRVANSTLLAHQVTAFVFATAIPDNPPADQVITAWINYGASQTWYAVTQTATSIIASIP